MFDYQNLKLENSKYPSITQQLFRTAESSSPAFDSLILWSTCGRPVIFQVFPIMQCIKKAA